MRSQSKLLRICLPLAATLLVTTALQAFGAGAPATQLRGAAAGYAGAHFGDHNIPAGCILDRDEANPDNTCFHMKVGLNGLDSPEVNVAVLVPVSPFAERDMRIMRQAVEMWDGGIHQLARQMNMAWLAKGVHINVTTKLVPVDANGVPTQAINLVKPKIVVIATNPVGGIGIGIDPVYFASSLTGALGISGENGVPCQSIPNPFSMMAWQARPGFDDHHGALGGTMVSRCDGPGGNVCFSVNGAVDPVPGKTDFFSLFDLVAHETGHCLTLGHVGDGADGPWGPTPTNDIMAYSSDPVDVTKCVSTLDVEGFALRMSNFLDTNGDHKVNARDLLKPNDVAGDAANSFQLQNPKDHWYASSTGDPEDCPQPDWGALPLAEETDWQPGTVATTNPALSIRSATATAGTVAWNATAGWVSKQATPTARTASVWDPSGDGVLPMTDITDLTASVTPTAVKGTIKVDSLWPTAEGGRVTGYGFYVGGRKFDSFVTTQGTTSDVQTIDSGARFMMPAGTSTWDTAASTVSFTIPRSYLAAQRILPPYSVFAETGVHIRTKDWVTSLDRAPAKGVVRLAAPAEADAPRDAPMDKRSTTRTTKLKHSGGNSFTIADTSTYGLPLVPEVGNVHHLLLPIAKQSTATVTLKWDDPSASLGLAVKGGSGQETRSGSQTVTVTVPWAHRDLTVEVIPSMILGATPVTYTVTSELTTLTANADGDGVPDIADKCPTARGPVDSAGCPDTDRDGILDLNDRCPKVAGLAANGCPTASNDRVVALLDGKRVGMTYLMTRHGSYGFSGSTAARPGKHTLTLVWYAGSSVVKSISRALTVS
ncbi:MAG: Thrombospondin type 3 repeat [Frankiales bacterium]|nr:Thrombospondin type 3 repeat [Frankiales bacterium]